MIDSISPDRRERWFNHVANLLCLRQILDRHWLGLGDKRLQEECSFHQIEPVSEGRNINVGANDTHGYSNHEIEKQLQLRATKLLLLGSSAQPCFNQILQQILDDLNTPDASNSDRNDKRYYSDVTDQRDLDHKVGARHDSSTEGWEQWEDSLSNKDVPESDPGSEASTTNAMLFNMPLKSRRSLLNKLARKHRLHPSGVETEIGAVTSPCPATDRIEVNDVVRSSIVCTSVTQILRLLRILRSPETGSPICVLNVKNRFKNPLPSGYRDFLVSFRVQVPDSNSNSVTALTTSSTTDSSHSGQNVEKLKGDGSNTDINYSDDIPTYEDSGEIVEAGAVRDPKVEKVGPSSGRTASCGVNMKSDVSRIVERKFISPVYFTCELQIHLLPFLAFSHRVEILRSPKVPQYISSYSMYVHFRQYFLSTKYDVKRAKTRFKVVEKMNQSLDHPRLLENAIEKFFEGLGRVTKELDRLAAHFEFFQFVGKFMDALSETDIIDYYYISFLNLISLLILF